MLCVPFLVDSCEQLLTWLHGDFPCQHLHNLSLNRGRRERAFFSFFGFLSFFLSLAVFTGTPTVGSPGSGGGPGSLAPAPGGPAPLGSSSRSSANTDDLLAQGASPPAPAPPGGPASGQAPCQAGPIKRRRARAQSLRAHTLCAFATPACACLPSDHRVTKTLEGLLHPHHTWVCARAGPAGALQHHIGAVGLRCRHGCRLRRRLRGGPLVLILRHRNCPALNLRAGTQSCCSGPWGTACILCSAATGACAVTSAATTLI